MFYDILKYFIYYFNYILILQTLKSTIARRDSLNYKVLNTNNIFSSLYQNNPRMIPDILIPECLKMHISIQPKTPVIKYKNRKREANNKEKKHQHTIKKNGNI